MKISLSKNTGWIKLAIDIALASATAWGAFAMRLGLPIPNIRTRGPAASCALLVEGESTNVCFSGLDKALAEPDTQLRLFGKPEIHGSRRLGVALALGDDVEGARAKARTVAEQVEVLI